MAGAGERSRQRKPHDHRRKNMRKKLWSILLALALCLLLESVRMCFGVKTPAENELVKNAGKGVLQTALI